MLKKLVENALDSAPFASTSPCFVATKSAHLLERAHLMSDDVLLAFGRGR